MGPGLSVGLFHHLSLVFRPSEVPELDCVVNTMKQQSKKCLHTLTTRHASSARLHASHWHPSSLGHQL